VKKLIIFLVSGMLLLASGARSQEIFLICKFESGSSDLKKSIIEKGARGTEDFNIILNISKKKIIEAPLYFKNREENKIWEFGGHETRQSSSWSDNEIKWFSRGETPSTGFIFNASYNLNRRSGVLQYESYIKLGNETGRDLHQYNCSKQDKKF
jgi:hypothetical protein